MEKITGQRFEDYVTQNFFLPIGMKTATYFERPTPELTTPLLRGRQDSPPLLEHPSAPRRLYQCLRQRYGGVCWVLSEPRLGGGYASGSVAFIDRMETPTRTWAAQQGLKAGYGLSNYTSIQDGFVYHGHNGGVDGGLTDMSYLPE